MKRAIGFLLLQVVLGGPFNPYALRPPQPSGGGTVFIYPNAHGWTTIEPGGPHGGITQYFVTPSYPGYQPSLRDLPSLPGFDDEDE